MKSCNFLSLYRSSNQSQDDFETFTGNHELNLENLVQINPFVVLVVGGFNAKSSTGFVKTKVGLKET